MDEQFLEATISIRGVICDADGSVLVIYQTGEGGWELPGGRIRREESVRGCLRREIREETGLRVEIQAPVNAHSWRNRSGNGRFAVYYRCTTNDEGVTLSHEHTESAWVDESTAIARLSEPQATAVERALNRPSSSTV